MDRETIEEVKEVINSAADVNDVEIEQLIIFGSRARDDYSEESDIDIMIVSDDFKDIEYLKRAIPFQRKWKYGEMPTPEFICLSVEEFEEKRDKKPHIVNSAVEEGVKLA